MNLPIIQSIFHGALRPNLILSETRIDGKLVLKSEDNLPYQELLRTISNIPTKLEDIEKLCLQTLGEYAQFDFLSEKPYCIANIAPDEFTSIPTFHFSANIQLEKPATKTPYLKFYETIITLESTRIKLALLNFADISKSDIDTRGAVKDTLKQIYSYSKEAINRGYDVTLYSTEPIHEVSEQDLEKVKNDNSVFLILKTQLIKLYFEIVLMFQSILTDKDFISFDDYIYNCYGDYPTAEQSNAYQVAAFVQYAQMAIAESQAEQENTTLLAQLYKAIESNSTAETLKTATVALENCVFLQHTQQPIPTFEQLINQDFVNLIIKEQKHAFKQRYEREEIALDRANTIDEIIVELEIKTPLQSSLSISNNLSNFLNQQKEIYLKDPSALFKVAIEKQANETKNKPQPTIKPMQIRTKLAIAHKYLAFLNGVNPKNNDRIMSEADYKLLVGYVEELIQKGTIPNITRKIPKTNIPKTWIKYTLYLIHQELFSSIQDTWIQFMQAAFVEFSEKTVTFDTLKTKFSVYPSGYKQVVKTIEE